MKQLHDYTAHARAHGGERRHAPAGRPTCEIDLGAIAANLRAIRALVAPGTKVAAVVKADAYGHGARRTAAHLQRLGVEWFAVATIAEGTELRKFGITGNILTLNALMPSEFDTAITHSITVSIGSLAEAEILDQIAFHLGRTAKAHLMIDTGLSRGGFLPHDFVRALPALRALDSVLCEGMWTHFSSLKDLEAARAKVELFRSLVARARHVLPLTCVHMAGSVATALLPESHFDMVRPGIALYGYLPHVDNPPPLAPAMTVTAPLVAVRRYPAGTPLSYEGLHVLPRDANIGIVRHGYAEGYDVKLTNTGEVVLDGARYPVVGRITMDQMLVDLGDDVHHPGERATLFGRSGPSVLEVAQRAGSLPHAVLVAVGGRVVKNWVGAETAADHADATNAIPTSSVRRLSCF
jgi:alanine racemase